MRAYAICGVDARIARACSGVVFWKSRDKLMGVVVVSTDLER